MTKMRRSNVYLTLLKNSLHKFNSIMFNSLRKSSLLSRLYQKQKFRAMATKITSILYTRQQHIRPGPPPWGGGTVPS